MKYFELDTKKDAVFSPAEIMAAQISGFSKKLDFTDAFAVLEEQCRPLGLQPELYLGAVRIVAASKKFMNRERRFNGPMSKRGKDYMEFCEKGAV